MALSHWHALRAIRVHFTGGPAGPCRLPMSVVRPASGAEGVRAGLEALAEADPGKVLQIVVSIESPSDPAWAEAEAFRAAHSERDVLVLAAGPPGTRMPHVHNKLAGLERAKHPRVIFSDADALVSRELLADAARAFTDGAQAVCAAVVHAEPRTEGEWWFLIAHNHCFSFAAAESYRSGAPSYCSGAFMGFTRDALERLGGLEPFARHWADDAAIGTAARRAGIGLELLRVPVVVREIAATPASAFARVARWGSMNFWTNPVAWLVPALLNGLTLSIAAMIAARSGPQLIGAVLTMAHVLAQRAAVAYQADGAWRRRQPRAGYARLLLADLFLLAAWPLGPRRVWPFRSRRVRLSLGGTCEIL